MGGRVRAAQITDKCVRNSFGCAGSSGALTVTSEPRGPIRLRAMVSVSTYRTSTPLMVSMRSPSVTRWLNAAPPAGSTERITGSCPSIRSVSSKMPIPTIWMRAVSSSGRLCFVGDGKRRLFDSSPDTMPGEGWPCKQCRSCRACEASRWSACVRPICRLACPGRVLRSRFRCLAPAPCSPVCSLGSLSGEDGGPASGNQAPTQNTHARPRSA